MQPELIRNLAEKDAKSWYRLSLASFYFLHGLVFASWACRIPDIKTALGMSDGVLGAMLFFPPAGQLATMTLVGWSVGKFGSRAIIILAATLYPLCLLLLGLAASTWQLALGLFLFGISLNFSNISINAQAIGVERLYRGRSIMASFHGIWSLAGLTGGILGMILVACGISPIAHFMLVYGIGLVILFSMKGTMLPRDGKMPQSKTGNENAGQRAWVWPDRYLLMLGLIAFGAMACEGTMFDWSNVYFEDVIHPPKYLSRLGYVAAMFCMMCGRFTADGMIARFGVVRILTVSGITIASGLFTVALFPFLATATLGFMLIGFGVSAVVPIAYSLSGRSTLMKSGAAIAVVSTLGMMGFLLGPPIIGFVAELLNLRWSLGMVGFVGLLIAVFAHMISRDVKTPKQVEEKCHCSGPLLDTKITTGA